MSIDKHLLWFNLHELNNSLVVFLHGGRGDKYATWRGIPEALQSVFPDSPRLRSYDYCLFEYDSGFRRQMRLEHVVDIFDQFLEQLEVNPKRRIAGRPKYHTIVLIGHSQGGIVGRLLILMAAAGETRSRPPIELIITLGTPNRGMSLFTPFHLLHRIPLIRQFAPLRQWAQLSPRNPIIKRISEEWNAEKLTMQCENRTSDLRSVAVVSAYDCFISEKSAAGYPFDIRYVSDQPHRGLSKTTNVLPHVIRRELEDHRYPEDVIKALNEIRFDSNKRTEFFSDALREVWQAVKESRGGYDQATLRYLVNFLLLDFLHHFEERPMRNLELVEAAAEYARRRLA